jgi:hypothetical protein
MKILIRNQKIQAVHTKIEKDAKIKEGLKME